MPAILSLDTICNSATYFVGQWTPELKRNQSRDLLRLVLSKMYFPSSGNLFHARIRASHAALAASLDLSREWTCKLSRRLCESQWLVALAPRLPDGKQEISIYKPGKRLKRLLVMLLRSKQRIKTRVNDSSQKFLTQEEREKNKARFAELIEEVGKKMEERQAQQGRV
jgi:hypothetical protein